MPKVTKTNKSKKLTPSKLIKTNGKFSKKKLGLFILGFGIVGTIALRFTFASATPTICYHNTCGTRHDFGGHGPIGSWGDAWHTVGDNGGTFYYQAWDTENFPSQSGYSAAPSGVAFKFCVQLRLTADNVGAKRVLINTFTRTSSQGISGASNYSLSLSDLRYAMTSKAGGSYLEASNSNMVQGVYCNNTNGAAGNYLAPGVQIYPEIGSRADLWINYVSMQRM